VLPAELERNLRSAVDVFVHEDGGDKSVAAAAAVADHNGTFAGPWVFPYRAVEVQAAYSEHDFALPPGLTAGRRTVTVSLVVATWFRPVSITALVEEITGATEEEDEGAAVVAAAAAAAAAAVTVVTAAAAAEVPALEMPAAGTVELDFWPPGAKNAAGNKRRKKGARRRP
jgi:hypothetical protein